MDRDDLPTRWLRERITAHREKLGHSRHKVADAIGISSRTLTRAERGPFNVGPETLELLAGFYELPDEETGYLRYLRRTADTAPWWDRYRDLMSFVHRDHCDLEQIAQSLATYSSVVPGYLQTPRYSDAIQHAGITFTTEPEAGQFIRLRQDRQKFLLQRGIPIRVLLTRNAMGLFGEDIAAEQAEHLRGLRKGSRVEIRIHSATPVFLRAPDFNLFEHHDRNVLCAEVFEAEVHHEGDSTVMAAYRAGFEKMWQLATPMGE